MTSSTKESSSSPRASKRSSAPATIHTSAPKIPWRRLHAEAQSRFGIDHFRPGQREVLQAVFSGRDAVALMPTGSGKSLCYQLPAVFLPKPVVVVSPLLALMEDQREKAEDAEIAVEKIDSTLTAREKTEAEQAIEGGEAQLIYCTPERLENGDFLATLAERGISLLAIDEAHCVSQWGHDFRPAYMGLADVRKRLGNPPVLALTATATEAVVADIITQLGMHDPVHINTGVERPNLAFQVHHTVNADAKLERIRRLLSEEEGSGIIYTASVKSAGELYEWLQDRGMAVGRYHGKLPTREREAMQSAFMSGEYKVLIATKAFGMGIDKPDIRFVYHYEFPDSLESYYQEAGRAGRDGLPARAVLLYRLEDKRIQRFFLLGRYPRLDELQSVLAVFNPLASPSLTQTSDPTQLGPDPGPSEPSQADPSAPFRSLSSSGKPTEFSQSATPGQDPEPPKPAPARSMAVLAIAKRSGVGKRRIEAILHILKSAGLVRRTTRGYARRAAPVTEDELQALLDDFTDRGGEDKNRLDEMMRYAESPSCRKQLLRAYFGEPEADPCGACDNCLDPQKESLAAELPKPIREQAVKIQTAIGAIVTTAPETLPTRDESPFQSGDGVRHAKFGPGRVVELDGENLLVRFEQGMKRVRPTYLRPA